MAEDKHLKKQPLKLKQSMTSSDPKQQKFYRRLYRKDKIARSVVTTGGYGIIVSIVAIFVFLVYQSLPLSFGASVKKLLSFSVRKSNTRIVLTGIDQYKEVYYQVFDTGIIQFRTLSDQKIIQQDSLPLLPGEKILSAAKGNLRQEQFAVGTDSGRIITGLIEMNPIFHGEKRIIVPNLEVINTFQAETPNDSVPAHVEKIAFAATEDEIFIWFWENHTGNLHGKSYNPDFDEWYDLPLAREWGDTRLSSLTISSNGENLALGFTSGEIFYYQVEDGETVTLVDHTRAAFRPISALRYLLGDEALVVGDTDGNVSVWFAVKSPLNIKKLTRIRIFKPHGSAVTQIYPSSRNRLFMTIDTHGEAHLNYSTTGRTQLEFQPAEYPIQTAAIAPKADGIIAIDTQENVGIFELKNPHPETTLKTLFGKVWYEGYDKPAFVWQSTGGSDEFEPKLSLIPLIFGTFKGTFYAMLFSVPMAILAAIYVSQFAPYWLARLVKPTVEIMAALPSVVIGLLAGLYFSPLFDKHLMSVFLIFFTLPVIFLIGVILWRLIPERFRMRVPIGWELWIVTPIVLATVGISIALAHPLELWLFGGDIRQWLTNSLGMVYDTRNSIVVGFALGFAVIPIIFTMAEDALSNVPESLTSASLALGASRWQTVRKVVLPAAAGGIFAAIMLGFGRAVGETMIVLMATGNTPILDFSPFNGFRAMSACIAVEIPEAPVGGTLYRVLFLTGLLLFLFTFVINSVSAIVGERLRKKYARF